MGTSSLFLGLLLASIVVDSHANFSSQCIVRDDCSYAIQVVKPATGSKDDNNGVLLEGSSVALVGRNLDCKSVKRTSPSSWMLDYDILRLQITNHVENNETNSAAICVLSWTATNDIFPQELMSHAPTSVDPHALSTDQVVTTFPSFSITTNSSSSSLFQLDGRLSWYGSFMQGRVNQGCTSGTRGGPCVLFERNNPSHGTVVILSPLNQFLVTTQTSINDSVGKSALSSFSTSSTTEFVWGSSTFATMEVIPKGYTHSFVALIGQDGITDTVNLYGRYMRQQYKLARMQDFTLQTLGYQTDNGAQYCFCKYMCDIALLATLRELIQHHKVPVRYLSFQNAWWPTSHSAPWCVSDWSTWTTNAKGQNTKFPMSRSVSEFIHQLPNEMPVQLYAPYFCDDTVYAESYTFLSSNSSMSGLCHDFDFRQITPDQSFEFYSWFLQKAKSEVGMLSYELDFVNQNLNCINEFTTSTEAAASVFDGMANAAQSLGLVMQWCYATPSAALQSLNYPSMTNMRGSFDYYYGESWDIGTSSLFLWALDIAPSTDTFWTSDNGNVATTMGGCDKKGCPDDHSESGCELHTILAVMSMGPVGFSDAAGQTNVARIMKTCRADGVLLQPNKPLTTVDGHLDQKWRILQSYSGPIQSSSNQSNRTRSDDTTKVWAYYVVAHRLTGLPNQQLSVPLSDLWPHPLSGSEWFIVWDHDSAACKTDGASAEQCGKFVTAGEDQLQFDEESDDYQSVRATIFPTMSCPRRGLGASKHDSVWALLGEIAGKYVSVSNQRFRDVECAENGLLSFSVLIAPGETVTVAAINGDNVLVRSYSIAENSNGSNQAEGLEILSVSFGNPGKASGEIVS